MKYLVNHWEDKSVGLQDVPVLTQLRATDEAVATIDATVAAFFAGKGEVVGPFDSDGKLKEFGNNIAGSGKAPKRIEFRDKENPKVIRYRYEDEKATAKHVLTATLCTRDDRGSDEDLDGELVKPFVHLVFEDGSQADIEAIGFKKPKKPAHPAGNG